MQFAYLLWLFVYFLLVHISMAKINDKLDTINKLKMNADQYKRVENLHLNMYASAMKQLIGSVGRDTYKKLSPERAKEMRDCLDKVSDNDLKSGAQCIVDAWTSKFTRRIGRTHSKQEALEPAFKVAETAESTKKRLTPRLLKYRSKKERKKRSNNEEDNDKFQPTTMDEAPALHSKYGEDSLMAAGAKLFLNGINSIRNKTSKSPSGAFMNLQKLQKLIEIHSEARKYRHSMADVVLDRKGKQRRIASASERLKAAMPYNQESPLMQNMFNLLDAFEKHNKNTNYKFLSPRFGSVLPDKRENMKESLSPNIFPMYNDKNGILPVPELLDDIGLSEKEKTAMMDLIVEASGASKLVEDTMQLFQTNETLALNDEINEITQLMQQRVQQVVNSSLNSEHQQMDMQSRNFAFLNRSQLEMLYGPKGLTNVVPFDFSEYEKMNRADLQKSLMNAVRSIADGQSLSSANFSPKRRRKRQEPVGAPGVVLVGDSTILAPFVFAPSIIEFVILGPVILSPSLFSPEILAPYLLGPVILSPSIGDPLILTPYVLSPKILSPEIWAVYVLSPYVISPNILNPFVMSPLILSPHVLSPDILSPNLLNAIILNPYALSPPILTESAFVFDILSPNAFSRRRK